MASISTLLLSSNTSQIPFVHPHSCPDDTATARLPKKFLHLRIRRIGLHPIEERQAFKSGDNYPSSANPSRRLLCEEQVPMRRPNDIVSIRVYRERNPIVKSRASTPNDDTEWMGLNSYKLRCRMGRVLRLMPAGGRAMGDPSPLTETRFRLSTTGD